MRLLPLLALPFATATLHYEARDALKPRNWDLRLLKPGCKTNESNIDLSVYHASGIAARGCTALDESAALVDSVSWKSPEENSRYDLCMFADGQCGAAGFVGVIRGGWEVCYPYRGWGGFTVVAANGACI